MFERKEIQNLSDYFMGLSSRKEKGVYFYRINGCNEAIREFIGNYYEASRTSGVVIEGRIPNPDEKNLAYYQEMMGMDFQMNMGFMASSLKKWLPRMNEYQRNHVAMSIYDTLDAMRAEGRNDNMLKNAYIKFMCWLYYKFERIVNHLGEDTVPKILYEGKISSYELKMLIILSNSGCDIVLLQYQGDAEYLKIDPGSKFSCALLQDGLKPFPPDFSIKQLRSEMEKRVSAERLYGTKPQLVNCTNAWTTGSGFEDFKKSVGERGSDPKLFYNCFVRMSGVEDKITYPNELYLFYAELKNMGRKTVIVENEIPKPSMEEIAAIRRNNYKSTDQMLLDLSSNIKYSMNIELQRLMNKAFIDIMTEESKHEGMNVNKLTNKAVYLLCWLKRYQGALFVNWRMPEVSCFIYLGGCRNETEACFLRLLARLPADVLILNPNLNEKCLLSDPLLYEIHHTQSLSLNHFPSQSGEIRMGTAAYHAERELDTIMYQDSGLYRNQQYEKAVSVTLQTMYEEIALLWDQEVKYRPNFSTVDSIVNIPVIFSKVSGVKDEDVAKYWSGIGALRTPETYVIKKAPFILPTDPNPMKAHATEFYKNGRLQRAKIKAHTSYPYGFLREEIQEHILDKLQLLLEQRTIKGTFENGTEYTVIATVLNLNKDLVRMIQKFDFTKKNPKLIYINAAESMISLEDSILTAFLNLVGFDIVFFVPTGYQSIEKYFNRKIMEEHQIGGYLYDLQPPDLDRISSTARRSWREKIFKRGN